jgi:hypothetical protein
MHGKASVVLGATVLEQLDALGKVKADLVQVALQIRDRDAHVDLEPDGTAE